MSTINLRDGLEVLYYFGEQDFDPQRNQLQDHSGYGRHASTSGSVSVGVNGPNGFESADFTPSSNDGIFAKTTQFSDRFTVAVEANVNSSNLWAKDNALWMNGNNSWEVQPTSQGSLQWVLDTTNSSVGLNADIATDEYQNNIFRYDGSTAQAILDGDVIKQSGITGNINLNDTSAFSLCGGANENLAAKVSYFAVWSRALSEAEIAQLNDLTAPRRSQL